MPKRLTHSELHIRELVKRDARKRSTIVAYRKGVQAFMQDAYSVTYTYRRLAMIEDRYAGKRLRRRAYVCTGSEVKVMHDVGYSSITDAFVTRPRDCKYCVFEKPEGGAILVNMFELIQSGDPMELTVKPNTDVEFPSVDAALMYALTIE